MVPLRCAWVILFCKVVLTSATHDFDELAKQLDFEDGITAETATDNLESTTYSKLQTDDEEENQVDYRGAQVLQVEITSQAQENLIHSLSDKNLIDVWFSATQEKITKFDFMVMPENFELVNRLFRDLNTTTSVFINDVQKIIAEENPVIEVEDSTRAPGNALNWDSYFKFGIIHDFLDNLALEYPDICKVQTIGKTVEGRDMKLLTISSGGDTKRPAIFIDGGLHAREWISPAVVTYMIRELVENRTNHGLFATGIDYHIIPLVNVDGYDYSHRKNRMWRKNKADLKGLCNGGSGVDLNRNFGYKWGGKGATLDNACSSTYAGRSAFTEPESRAIRDYVVSFGPGVFKGYISFHSYGQVILFPWGYTKALTPDSEKLKSVAMKAADAILQLEGKFKYGFGSTARVLYRAPGNSVDWARAVGEIKFSYCVELPDKGKYGFVLPARFIKPTGRDSMEILKTIAEEVLKS